MEEAKKKALVLIDYENLYMGGINQGLQLTDNGLQYLVTYLKNSYDLDDGLINVVCRFRDFNPLFQNFVESLSLNAINALDEGKDVADGYLITEGTQQLIENNSLINELVLIGGDNVYSGFIRKAVNNFKKTVKIIAWENSIAASLSKINQTKVSIQLVDSIFKIGSGEEIREYWFVSDGCTDLEFAVISFIANSPYKDGYHLNSLANKMVESPDSRVQSLNNYEQTRKWLLSLVGDQNPFSQSRDKNKGVMLKLNETNSKVQYVMSKLKIESK